MSDPTKGLYLKFNVQRTDGRSAPGAKHAGCHYFVLDLTHDPHAIPAIRAYASHCAAELPLLARDLREQAKLRDDSDSNLVQYARAEMERAGLFDADADYGGAVAHEVLALVELFAAQGHSGMSASLALAVFEKVARFQPLTPLTSNPDEWMLVTEGMWQSRRSPSVFSHDGGQTWYDVDDEKRKALSELEETRCEEMGFGTATQEADHEP